MSGIVPVLGFFAGFGIAEMLVIAVMLLIFGGTLAATIVLGMRAANGTKVSDHAYCPHCGKQLR